MDRKVRNILSGFVKNSGSRIAAINSATAPLHLSLPADYLELLQYMDGGEGFLGAIYVRFYPSYKLIFLNSAYSVQKFAPGLLVFGSNGGGEAYAFDYQHEHWPVIRIPFIPMDLEYMKIEGTSLTDFLLSQSERSSKSSKHIPNPKLIGKELHEVLPVVFGGSATDPANKVLLEPERYAAYVKWWNDKYQELKAVVANNPTSNS